MASEVRYRTSGNLRIADAAFKPVPGGFPGVKQVAQEAQKRILSRGSASAPRAKAPPEEFFEVESEPDLSESSADSERPSSGSERFRDLPEHFHMDLEDVCRKGGCWRGETLKECRGRPSSGWGRVPVSSLDPRLAEYPSYKCLGGRRRPPSRAQRTLLPFGFAGLLGSPEAPRRGEHQMLEDLQEARRQQEAWRQHQHLQEARRLQQEAQRATQEAAMLRSTDSGPDTTDAGATLWWLLMAKNIIR
jgi:hypothetical protein